MRDAQVYRPQYVVLSNYVGSGSTTHPNDGEAVVRMGHPAIWGGRGRHTPGAKAPFTFCQTDAKAEALAYLDAGQCRWLKPWLT
jgi:hypothetical protein